jgi:L-alanine-DL-glutamate epimerase-like enolase superfamily enzyme
MIIESIKVVRLLQPLTEPYHLAYGSITSLDSVWVCLRLQNGRTGWGECTPLFGYSDSNIEMVWATSNFLACQWVGKDSNEILRAPLRGKDGFLYTAVWTALEEANGNIPQVTGSVPLVQLLQERVDECPESALKRVRKLGSKVYKIKTGQLSIENDMERLHALQQGLQSGECIRIDANQSLTETKAATLMSICIPGKVELFEQPLKIADWQGCARLAKISPIPIMLDESIVDIQSLHKTAKYGAAAIVKLKWMKQGGWGYLVEMIKVARQNNLRVVLGNGVAGWINNRHEAIFWLKHLQDMNLFGEMNGYLKIKNKIENIQNESSHINVGLEGGKEEIPSNYESTHVCQYGA